ncbi:MAG TPA: HigA family addiction module antitoxin [Candidatus Sulfotelmatobacter sp.]|jgi:HTH-type transcriptional regulator/antitoxin HigA|nr:HigA family addiction module antitoxin [Candidatus Sulfotelmatobacter sp.]
MSEQTQTVGQVIKNEMEKRGWTQSDLAMVLGKHQPYINELTQDKRSITPEMAMALAAAFGNAPEFWLNLDAGYRLSLLEPNSEIERRAKIFGFAPVKDMEKRGWIRPTNSLDALEKELCSFYNIASLNDVPKIHVNARQPLKTEALDSAQIAWCMRASKLAGALDVERFKPQQLKDAMSEIRALADFPEKSKNLPKLMAEIGIRLVVVEPLQSGKIDGAAFWLADDAPVVVVSVRFDRIDCFWFTLAHEIMHILHKDAQSVDSDLVGESAATDLEEIEMRANRDAAAFLIPVEKLKSFMIRVKPFYSKERINQFAHRMQIHPGIVSGQLQFHQQIGWHTNREMLVKIRHHVTSTTLTDGWGKTAPTL